MSASDVDRLRADLAVLDRRIDRIERSAAMAMDGFSALRKRLEAVELAGTTRGGSAGPEGGVGVEQLEPLHADLATVRQESAGLREEVGGMTDRLDRVEDLIRAQRSAEAPGTPGSPSSAALGELRDEVAALRQMVVTRRPSAGDEEAIAALRDQLVALRADVETLRRAPTAPHSPQPEPEPEPEPDPWETPLAQATEKEVVAPDAAREPEPLRVRVAEPEPEPEPVRVRAAQTEPEPESESVEEIPRPPYRAEEEVLEEDPDTENEPLSDAAAAPLEEDPADADSDLGASTSIFIQPPPGRQRSDTMVEGLLAEPDALVPALRDAHWSHEILRVNAPVTLRCEAPGHAEDTPAEIVIEGTEQDEVARIDAVVAAGSVRAVWRYRYADDPNTGRGEPRFRFVVRIHELEAHSDFAQVQGWNPPPKKMGFSDMLRRKR